MTTREEALAACLALPGSYADHPFHDPNWAAVRRRENQRIFALVFERQGEIWMNLKADPLLAGLWRGSWPAVLPGYHMNKRHWVSVILNGSVPRGQLLQMIEDSFNLTAPKRRQRPAGE